jgi:hypothetical protein
MGTGIRDWGTGDAMEPLGMRIRMMNATGFLSGGVDHGCLLSAMR